VPASASLVLATSWLLTADSCAEADTCRVAAPAADSASLRTSSATTANPRPWSPRHDGSRQRARHDPRS
jgi:hypothetical protein